MHPIYCETCGDMIRFAAGEEPDENVYYCNDCVEITVSVKDDAKKKAAVEKDCHRHQPYDQDMEEYHH